MVQIIERAEGKRLPPWEMANKVFHDSDVRRQWIAFLDEWIEEEVAWRNNEKARLQFPRLSLTGSAEENLRINQEKLARFKKQVEAQDSK